ncbi:MAG: DUF362 domain-containing protein [Clostridia bacterium]|nr:DUF362 domain-containing protein [Clostridia bacterium]
MEKSKVYFTDFRTKPNVSQGVRLQKLCRQAGLEKIDFEGKFVAIKLHFGELGNFAYIRPNYVKAVADLVKELGGKPFLTDCNTLYPGSRKNAVDHLLNADINGFNYMTTGCHNIIADGLKGTDDVVVPVPNGVYCREAYIGRALYDADVIIVLSHFKGHEVAGFGGAVKNLGMSGGSRAGKMQQHNEGKPTVDPDACRMCRQCAKQCGSDAISYDSGKAYIDPDLCKGCGRCIGVCAFDAIYTNFDSVSEALGRKMAEYTAAIAAGKPVFWINMIMDVSPDCDCHGENDAPILPNLGMLASFDAVALDQACADLCLKADPLPNSQLTDRLSDPHAHTHNDPFKDVHPNTSWRECLEHAEKIGLGTRDYELVRMK